MRSVFYWGATGISMTKSNPYGALLAQAMEKLGVELVSGYAEDLNEAWLEENRGRVDVLHLHWPHYLYTKPDLNDTIARCTELIGHLSRARMLGYKVVWTVHNLYPHESVNRDLDRLARLALVSLASSLIVHCDYARRCVREQFYREEGVFTVPHGHFMDAYPNTVSRADARGRLGLSEAQFVYLFFGNIRPYKGVERLIDTFCDLPGEDLALVMAVKDTSPYSIELIGRARAADPRIRVFTEQFFPVEDFQVYLNAADVVVLPFVDILTSGSAVTAMSFGRPVIVPEIGCLPELVDETLGILYDAKAPGALAEAMVEMRSRDLEACSRAAYERAVSLDWSKIAHLTLEAYQCL
ncbi:MAG: glycosyltransferase [bacterium]|nr:glycosyltransferase [bacterium]